MTIHMYVFLYHALDNSEHRSWNFSRIALSLHNSNEILWQIWLLYSPLACNGLRYIIVSSEGDVIGETRTVRSGFDIKFDTHTALIMSVRFYKNSILWECGCGCHLKDLHAFIIYHLYSGCFCHVQAVTYTILYYYLCSFDIISDS